VGSISTIKLNFLAKVYKILILFAAFLFSFSFLLRHNKQIEQNPEYYFWSKQGIVLQRIFTPSYADKYDIKWKVFGKELCVVVETNQTDSLYVYLSNLRNLTLDSIKLSVDASFVNVLLADIEKYLSKLVIFYSTYTGNMPPKYPLGNSISCLEIDLKNLNYKNVNLFTHDTTMEIWFLNSDFDSDGDLYVFWNKVMGGMHTLRKVKKGNNWIGPDTIIFIREINGVKIFDTFLPPYNDLAIDNTGKFHVIGLDMGATAYAFSVDSGKTWAGYYQFPGDAAAMWEVKLLIDYKNVIHALFTVSLRNERGGYGLPDRIYHVFSRDGKKWSAPIEITQSLPYPKVVGLAFDAVVDSWNRIHLVFDAEVKGVAHLYHTYWNGYRWIEPQKIDFTYIGGIPRLSVDEFNNLHLVFSSIRLGGLIHAIGTPTYISSTPKFFELRQNYPNPFNSKTTIEFSIYKEAFVSLKIYDIKGHTIATLVNSNKKPGTYKVEFIANNLASGIYLVELMVDGQKEIRKILLVK
jgi:hypothetical protein